MIDDDDILPLVIIPLVPNTFLPLLLQLYTTLYINTDVSIKGWKEV